MTRLTQHITFDASHRLLGYSGNCVNCHGHTWSVDIEIESNRTLDSCGMLLDYKTIKNYFKETWDHRAILNMDDPLVDIFKNMGLMVTIMSGNPTAENLAKKILADMVLLANLDTIDHDDYARVVVHESTDNSAEEYL
jgi:6-pyruvoyltetrahydropterin/6-carboxytetrahydropterin synthase